jgi:putative DNA methylase
LKSLDIFSVHGFPVGLVQCESNLLGITNGSGSNVGSGGWSNIIDKYGKAKKYCSNPFEVRPHGARKIFVPIKGEWIGERANGARARNVSIHCATATTLELQNETVDAVFTDPPYFGNVQYGELMDFCYVWLRRLVGTEVEGFSRESTRSLHELTGNLTQARDLNHFADGLSMVYQRMARALKRGAPLAFTFHHNRIEAYHAVGVALLDAGLVCSATLPCPAEMGGSIHIHGTGSSIVDTIFVCRLTGRTRKSLIFENGDQLRDIVEGDLSLLSAAVMKPTVGDIRCITFGHLTRVTIWRLRQCWDSSLATSERVRRFSDELKSMVDAESLIHQLGSNSPRRRIGLSEPDRAFDLDTADAISF